MGFSTYGAMGYGLAMNGMPDNVHMTLTHQNTRVDCLTRVSCLFNVHIAYCQG